MSHIFYILNRRWNSHKLSNCLRKHEELISASAARFFSSSNKPICLVSSTLKSHAEKGKQKKLRDNHVQWRENTISDAALSCPLRVQLTFVSAQCVRTAKTRANDITPYTHSCWLSCLATIKSDTRVSAWAFIRPPPAQPHTNSVWTKMKLIFIFFGMNEMKKSEKMKWCASSSREYNRLAFFCALQFGSPAQFIHTRIHLRRGQLSEYRTTAGSRHSWMSFLRQRTRG